MLGQQPNNRFVQTLDRATNTMVYVDTLTGKYAYITGDGSLVDDNGRYVGFPPPPQQPAYRQPPVGQQAGMIRPTMQAPVNRGGQYQQNLCENNMDMSNAFAMNKMGTGRPTFNPMEQFSLPRDRTEDTVVSATCVADESVQWPSTYIPSATMKMNDAFLLKKIDLEYADIANMDDDSLATELKFHAEDKGILMSLYTVVKSRKLTNLDLDTLCTRMFNNEFSNGIFPITIESYKEDMTAVGKDEAILKQREKDSIFKIKLDMMVSYLDDVVKNHKVVHKRSDVGIVIDIPHIRKVMYIHDNDITMELAQVTEVSLEIPKESLLTKQLNALKILKTTELIIVDKNSNVYKVLNNKIKEI